MKGILIITTVGSEQQAVDIAQTLVEQKLAACVSYSMRFHSKYWWKGKVCSDQEVMMMIKSHKRQENNIIEAINKMHEYEVPEILCFDVSHGSEDYLKWIDDVVVK